MPLTLRLELLSNCYEATLGGTAPEWPPHPARLFCALVSVAMPTSPDDEALRWLEGQGPPRVISPDPVDTSDRTAFVPTNLTVLGGGHQVHIGRTSGARSWSRTVPAANTVLLSWPSAQPTEAILAVLDQLARRVGYVGRSTTQALLSFTTDDLEDSTAGYEPMAGGRLRLRVPYPGYLDRLRHAYDGGDPPWSTSRVVAYGKAEELATPLVKAATAPPAYPDLLVFAFNPGEGIDGCHAPAVARAFKAAVLQRLGRPRDDDPWQAFDETQLSLLHGHHDGTRRQCAFVALPFVGHPHATGEVLGVAVALSPHLDQPVRKALLQLVGLDRDGGPRLNELRVPGLGRRCHLGRPDHRETLRERRWCAVTTTWTTVLPIVLDWFPKRGLPAEEVVARGCEAAGYPRPGLVEIHPAAPLLGSPHVQRQALVRRQGDVVRPAVHATVRFENPIAGPVLVGHLRHLGLGLCLPGGKR